MGRLVSSLERVGKLLEKVSDKFLVTFNGIHRRLSTLETIPSRREDLESYRKPSRWFVGHLADVEVGHIELFKFREEFQLDYHLKRAGFLDKLREVHEKKDFLHE
jgi:hypothetical protein